MPAGEEAATDAMGPFSTPIATMRTRPADADGERMMGTTPGQDDGGDPVRDQLLRLITPRSGHFRLESGHHGDLWLDLDGLFARPARLRRLIESLAERLTARHRSIDAICGPLTGGAFVAQMVAAKLDVAFFSTERIVSAGGGDPDSVAYRLPRARQLDVDGQAIAVVDDAINAGSAIRGTLSELRSHGGEPVVIGALLVLGRAGTDLAVDQRLPIESLAHLPAGLWAPEDCPLCACGQPLDTHV